MRVLLIAVLTALMPVGAQAEDNLTLTVHVEGGRANVGSAMGALYESEETFMKSAQAEATAKIDADGKASLTFENLSPGEYAVTVFYDENGNGELDTGFLGIPKEKVGFSNNARGRMGPAPYEKARFVLSPGSTEITISLISAQDD